MLSENFPWYPDLPKIEGSDYLSFIKQVNNLTNNPYELNNVISASLDLNI